MGWVSYPHSTGPSAGYDRCSGLTSSVWPVKELLHAVCCERESNTNQDAPRHNKNASDSSPDRRTGGYGSIPCELILSWIELQGFEDVVETLTKQWSVWNMSNLDTH